MFSEGCSQQRRLWMSLDIMEWNSVQRYILNWVQHHLEHDKIILQISRHHLTPSRTYDKIPRCFVVRGTHVRSAFSEPSPLRGVGDVLNLLNYIFWHTVLVVHQLMPSYQKMIQSMSTILKLTLTSAMKMFMAVEVVVGTSSSRTMQSCFMFENIIILSTPIDVLMIHVCLTPVFW